MATPKDFNTTVVALLRDLEAVLPSKKKKHITLALTMSEAFMAMSPDSTMAVTKFWEIASVHQEAIQKRDPDALLDALQAVVPQSGLVRQTWSVLSPANRTVVLDYVVTLFEQASAMCATAAPKATEGPTGLYAVYNKMLKDFFTQVATSGGPGTASDTIQDMMDRLGVDTQGIFTAIARDLDPVLPIPDTMQSDAIMSMLVPPDDPQGIARKDADTLGDTPVDLLGNVSWASLLDHIAASKAKDLSMTWYYIKMMTFTLARCPPEVLDVMSTLAQDMMSKMGL
jgi:hypothetical protein